MAGDKNFHKIWRNYIAEADLIMFFLDGVAKSSSLLQLDIDALKVVTDDPQIKGKQVLLLINKNVHY